MCKCSRIKHLHFLHVDEDEEGHGKLLMQWEMMMEEVILFSFISHGPTFLELSSCSSVACSLAGAFLY